MKLNKIKNNRVFRIVSNRYFLIFISFVIWMVFFDENSFFMDREFNKTIDKLEADKDYYLKEIKKDTNKINELEDPDKLDQFARQKYNMKKENEDIFIIEYDTLK